MGKKPFGLYVHIPFCLKKCSYCDFLSAPASEEVKESYVNSLREEIEKEAVRYSDYLGKTIFFGGGTPTVLKPEQLEKILCKLIECFSIELNRSSREKESEAAEITLECNPGTVNGEDLRKLRRMGFNRLSVGLQSAQAGELKRLGRIHDWEDFLETYHGAREAGFRNINVDVMSALPGQSVESYVDTLQKVMALCPEHISAYSLMIEEGTPFYECYGEADRERQKSGEDKEHLLPSEEEERQMYELTEEMLGQRGYRRYEISNYALPGYECRHNITYWRRGNYLGLGLGAASLMENCRFTKTGDLKKYVGLYREEQLSAKENKQEQQLSVREDKQEKQLSVKEDKQGQQLSVGEHEQEQYLSVKEQMEEFMFLGLRLMEGVSGREFQECFQTSMENIYGDILGKLEKQGLLARKGDRIFLTKRGIDVSNIALVEFLL